MKGFIMRIFTLLKSIIERLNSVSDATELSNFVNLVFPVGSIIALSEDIDPNMVYIGTTWERFGAGQVLVGLNADDSDFNALGKTGGEKKHTLSVSEMPSHAHNIKYQYGSKSGGTWRPALAQTGSYQNMSTDSNGSNSAHNNLQPYTVVAYWKRTA